MYKFILATVLLVVWVPNQIGAQQVEQKDKQKGEIVLETVEKGISLDNVISLDSAISGNLGEVVLTLRTSPASAFSGPYSHLSNQIVQKELELMEEQKQQLRDLKESFSQRINYLKRKYSTGRPDEDKEVRKKVLKKAREEVSQQVKEILLPHQRERLKQVALQMKMKSRGDVESLIEQELAEALGISEEQKEKLKEQSEKIKAELEEEIARLKKKARKKLLGELTADQRKKLEAMLGSEFDQTPRG